MLRKMISLSWLSLFLMFFFVASCSSDDSDKESNETVNDNDTISEADLIDSDFVEDSDAEDDSDNLPEVFFCDPETNCPEIKIAGDSLDSECLGVDPCPIRGHYDPSLEKDPDGDLWMTYTRGTLISYPETSGGLAGTHEIYLANSKDNGKTWKFDSKIAEAFKYDHPDYGAGLFENEVSTIVRTADGKWLTMWFKYFENSFDTPGNDRSEFVFPVKKADSPQKLKDAEEIDEIAGVYSSEIFPPRYDLPGNIKEMSDCMAIVDPSLFTYKGETYLAVECIVIGPAPDYQQIHEEGRIELLKMTADGYEYVGKLAGYEEALSVFQNGEKVVNFAQADLAFSKENGKVLLVLTPVNNEHENILRGCVVFGVEDLTKAKILRDKNNNPVVLSRIESDSDFLGSGTCTYDPDSETGIIIVRMKQGDPDLRISMHETGVHPDF